VPKFTSHLSRRARLIAALVVLLVLAGGGVAYASLSTSSPSYVTATVTRGDVTQTLSEVGTVQPARSADVSFPVSGSVASVDVAGGDRVTAGEALARLDTTSLQSQVTTAEANLASAKLTLEEAESGQTATTGGSSSSNAQSATSSVETSSFVIAVATPVPSRTPRPTATRSQQPGSGSGGQGGSISALQREVVADQSRLDHDLGAAQADLAAALKVCGSSFTGGQPTALPTPTPSGSPTGSPTATPTATPSTSGGTTGACGRAETRLLGAESLVASDEAALAGAEKALDAGLTKAEHTSSTGTGTGTGSSSSHNNSGSATSTVPTAADLAAEQAQVDAATAALTEARQNLAAARIVTPISGTVAAVNFSAGQQVSASSTTEDIVVNQPGAYEATTTVPVGNLGEIKVGDSAAVTPDGGSAVIAGRISAIGVLPSSGTDYPVTVMLDSPAGLRDGASASVSLVVAVARGVLTVPVSAVHSIGTLHFVSVVSGGSTRTTPIEVGAQGSTTIAVTSGLKAGETVMLANAEETLPTSGTATLGGGGGGSPSPGAGARCPPAACS
jgi:multidrug efflux pump subunit AcrA (membrane-fusion protein)